LKTFAFKEKGLGEKTDLRISLPTPPQKQSWILFNRDFKNLKGFENPLSTLDWYLMTYWVPKLSSRTRSASHSLGLRKRKLKCAGVGLLCHPGWMGAVLGGVVTVIRNRDCFLLLLWATHVGMFSGLKHRHKHMDKWCTAVFDKCWACIMKFLLIVSLFFQLCEVGWI
jgi:hypothetical protein